MQFDRRKFIEKIVNFLIFFLKLRFFSVFLLNQSVQILMEYL